MKKLIILIIAALCAALFTSCEQMPLGASLDLPARGANVIQVTTDPVNGNATKQVTWAAKQLHIPILMADTSSELIAFGQVMDGTTTIQPIATINGNVVDLTASVSTFTMYGPITSSVKYAGGEGSPMMAAFNLIDKLSATIPGGKVRYLRR